MESKKINRPKLAIFMGLTLIILSVISYSLPKGTKILPSKKRTIVKEKIINTPVNLSLRDSIVNFGMELLGTPYVSASCSRDGFDCSGFVYFVFQNYKIKVPRSSAEFEHFGKEIPIEKVRKGDILLFLSPTRNVIGHIGIVTNPNGMETDFIHASSSKEMKVIISSLKQDGYKRRFVKAIDVLN